MPAFDAAANGTTGAINAASLTFSHTCTGSGLALYIGVASTAVPTKVTYGNFSLSKVGADVSNTIITSVWMLANPSTGANNVVVTMASSVTIIGGSVSITNASQEVTHLTLLPRTATAATSVSSIISPHHSDCFLLDVLGVNINILPTPGGGQTAAVTQQASGGAGLGMSYAVVSGKPDTTFSWTWVGSASASHKVIAIPGVTSSVPMNNLRPHPFSPGLAR